MSLLISILDYTVSSSSRQTWWKASHHGSQTVSIIKDTTWRSTTTFLLNNLKFHHLNLSALSAMERCLQKRNSVMQSSCLYVRVCVCVIGCGGILYSLYGQVCHSEGTHSPHCGAVCGPHQVRVEWQKGASRIKTRAANRKWVCKDKTRSALASVYEWSLVK